MYKFLVVLSFCILSYANAQIAPSWVDFAQKRSDGDMKNSVLPDYSYAGYHFSDKEIPDLSSWHTIDVTTHGALPDDAVYDDDAIQAAIDAAVASGVPTVVYFPAGKYLVADEAHAKTPIVVRGSHIVLKGAGSEEGGTEIYSDWTGGENEAGEPFAAGLWRFQFQPADLTSSTLTTIHKDISRGDFQVEVADPSGLSVGQTVDLYHKHTDSLEANMPGLVHKPVWNIANRGITTFEKHIIAAIDGSIVTFENPIQINLPTGNAPAELRSLNLLEEVGVEDIRFSSRWGTHPETFAHHANDVVDYAWRSLMLENVKNAWVQNCEFQDANVHLWVENSIGVTVRDVKVSGKQGHTSYAAKLSYGVLFENCRDEANMWHGPGMRWSTVNTVYLNCKMNRNQSVDCHGYHPYSNLLDGVEGGSFQTNGGAENSYPQSGPDLTFWNFVHANNSSSRTYNFWDNVGRKLHTYPYPKFVGFQSPGETITFQNEGLDELRDTQAYPKSLFKAQHQLRNFNAYMTASSEKSVAPAVYANDGDDTTRWNSNTKGPGEWLKLDLGAPKIVSSVTIKEAFGRINDYLLEYWDGSAWQTAASGQVIGDNKAIPLPNILTSMLRLTAVSIINDEDTTISIKTFSATATSLKSPELVLVSPTGNTEVEEGYALSVEANANDADGTIASVSLSIDGTLVREITTGPYIWGQAGTANEDELNGLEVGSHDIVIVATDNHGLTAKQTFELKVLSAEPDPYEGIQLRITDATITASTEKSTRPAADANDGDDLTRWNSDGNGTSQWLALDFGRERVVTSVIVKEAFDRVEDYLLEYWDGSAWLSAASGKTLGAEKVIHLPSISTNKIRLTAVSLKPDVTSSISIWTFDAFSPVEPYAGQTVRIDGATITASTEKSARPAADANDNDDTTRWNSDGNGTGQWLALDFGTPKVLSSVELKEAFDRIEDYLLESWDGTEWQPITTGKVIGAEKVIHLPLIETSKIRLTAVSLNEDSSISVWSFNAYTPAIAPEVQLVSPNGDFEIIDSEPFSVEATASDADDNLTGVSLLIDGSLVREITTAPFIWGEAGSTYQNELAGLTPGTYEISVVATDATGLSTQTAFSLTVNVHPRVLDPTGNAEYPIFADEYTEDSDKGSYQRVQVKDGSVEANGMRTWIKFPDFNFGDGVSSFSVLAANKGTWTRPIELRKLAPNGPLIGSIDIEPTSDNTEIEEINARMYERLRERDWKGFFAELRNLDQARNDAQNAPAVFKEFTTDALDRVNGIHDLYMVFPSGGVTVKSFYFEDGVGGISSLMLTSVADGNTRGGSTHGDSTFGTNVKMGIKNSKNHTVDRMGYVQFNLDEIPIALISADLYLHGNSATDDVSLNVYSILNDEWNEENLTWNNESSHHPTDTLVTAEGSILQGAMVFSPESSVQGLDVTEAVRDNLIDGLLSFAIADENVRNQTVNIITREAEVGSPEIHVLFNYIPSEVGTLINAAAYDSESHPDDRSRILPFQDALGFVRAGTWIGFRDFNFDKGADTVTINANTGFSPGGTAELRLGSPEGELIGSVEVTRSSRWSRTSQSYTAELLVSPVGQQDLYFVFTGSDQRHYSIDSFQFDSTE